MASRKRGRLDAPSSSNDVLYCSSCRIELSSTPHYVLSSCNHPLCIECFPLIRERAYGGELQCPVLDCQSNKSVGYRSVRFESNTRSSNSRKTIIGDLIRLQQPRQPTYDKRYDPARYYYSQSQDYQEQHMNISFSFLFNGKTKTITFDLPFTPQEILCDETQKCIESLFCKLHTPIMANDKLELQSFYNQQKKDESILYTNMSHLYEQAANGDSTLLRKIMNALGNGTFLKDMEDSNANFMKRKRLSLASAEITRTATQKNLTLLQSAIGELMKIEGVTHNAQKVLVDFGLSGSRKAINISDTEKIHSEMTKDYNYKDKKWCLFIVIYDNVGFRIRGGQCGYDQYTALQLLVKSVEELKKIGFYAPPGQPKLCRRRLKWKDIRDECDLSVIVPGDDEYDELGYHHLLMIESVLESYNLLPSDEEMEEIAANAVSKENMKCEGTTLKAEFRQRRPLGNNEVLVEATIDQDEIEDGEDSDIQTMYDVNGCAHINPLHMDLNSRQTVRAINKFTEEARAKSQEPGANDDSNDDSNDDDDDDTTYGGEKPLMSDRVFSSSDGLPSYMWTRQRDEHLQNQNSEEFKYNQNFSGAFHVLLNTAKIRGAIFQHTHLIDLIKPYREGKGSQQWVLDPSDPNQTLKELFEISGAVYARGCKKTSLKLNKAFITADQVHVHLWLCAQEDANEFLIFLELKLCDIISMMVDSEKTAPDGKSGGCNPSLFRTALTLAGLFLAVTNSYKYIQLISDFKVWWRCASDADRKIWDEFIFTAKTADGKRIFLDRFMEWMVRDLRSVLGKFQSRNMYSKFIEAVVSLNDRRKSKKAVAEAIKNGEKNETGDPTTSTVDVGYVFVLTSIQLKKINLWGLGEKRYYLDGRERKMQNGKIFDLSGKVALNPDIISIIDIGLKRLGGYGDKFYVKGTLNVVVRPYKETNLTRVPILLSDKDIMSKRQHKWATSLKASELVDFYKDDLVANLEYINVLLNDAGRDQVQTVTYSLAKKHHAEAVAEARDLAKDLPATKAGEGGTTDFSQPGAWVEDISKATTIVGRLEDALKHKFFGISDKAKEKFGEFKKHEVKGAGELNNPESPSESLLTPIRTPIRTPNSTGEHSYTNWAADYS